MTPQIALDLSLDGIAVLSRAPDGPDRGKWHRQGIVRLDAPDMAEGLRRLRRRCVEIAGEDFTSILVIPDTQLLFTSLERDDRDPKVTIRSQLAGRTPYAIEDLAFDYVERGDRLQVAVVARETLNEAESFAADFGFRPVAHIATPSDPSYDGIAQFGLTTIAPSLAEGARVSLDLRRTFEVVPAPDRRESADAIVEEPASGAEVGAGSADPAPGDEAAAPIHDTQPSTPQGDDPSDESARDFAALVAAAPAPADPGVEDAPARPHASGLPEGLPPASRPPSEPVMVKPPVPSAAAAIEPVRPAFSSRRKPEAASAPRLATPRLAPAPAPPLRARAEPPAPETDPDPGTNLDTARDAPSAATGDTGGGGSAPSPAPQAADGAPATGSRPDAPRAPDAVPPRRPAALAAMEAALRAPPASPGGRLGRIGDRIGMRASAPVTVPPAPKASPMAADGALSEAQALSLPGRGRAAKPPRRGPARLGLYLTLSLLALLGLVALWAVAFAPGEPMLDNATPAGDPAVQLGAMEADAAPPPPAEPAETDLASLLPEAGTAAAAPSALVAPPIPEKRVQTAAGPDASLPGDGNGTGPAAASADPVDPLPGALEGTAIIVEAASEPAGTEDGVEPLAGTAADSAESLPLPERFDDTPGLAPPPETPDVTDIYLASIDAAVADGDAVALPAAAAPADAFTPQASPLPAGADVPVGADGLVAATAEGVLAPGGYRVVAGPPETMPVPRAADTPAAVAAVAPETEALLAEMRRTRPVARPGDAAARVERVSFGGLSRAEITRVRPSQRPGTIVAQAAAREAEATAQAAEAAAAIAATEEAETSAALQAAAASLARPADLRVVEPIGEGSRYALAASERPLGRPRSVEQGAARLVTTRRQTASAPAAAPQAQAAAPQAQPSRQTIRSAGGSVARAATESDAIRLREINLIGVYGRAADRRALVRLSNGRYVKVKVGDQLDRGRVMAIGESEVVYQRGGRNMALRMPST